MLNNSFFRIQPLRLTSHVIVWKPLAVGPTVKVGENVMLDDDRRYFYTDTAGHEVQDLEASVMTSPHDTQLWLKLAARKLHNPSR